MKKFILINILVLLHVATFSQTSWYISVHGDDSTGTGTYNNPFLNFSYALENAVDYDTIYILPGVYDSTNVIIKKNHLFITGIHRDSCVFNQKITIGGGYSSYLTIKNIKMIGGLYLPNYYTTHCLFDSCEIQSVFNIGLYCSYNEFSNNIIKVKAFDNRAQYCYFYKNNFKSIEDRVYSSNGGRYNRFINNVFESCNVGFYGEGHFDGTHRFYIANNTFINCSTTLLDNGYNDSDWTFINNLIINTDIAINKRDYSTSIFKHNNIWNNTDTSRINWYGDSYIYNNFEENREINRSGFTNIPNYTGTLPSVASHTSIDIDFDGDDDIGDSICTIGAFGTYNPLFGVFPNQTKYNKIYWEFLDGDQDTARSLVSVRVQLSDTSGFTSVLKDTIINSVDADYHKVILPYDTYYYRIQAIDNFNDSSNWTNGFDTIVVDNIVVPPPSGAYDEICFGETNPTLTASGTNIKWYSDSELTNLIIENASYTPAVFDVGTYNYYVTQTEDGAESMADTIIFTIHGFPSKLEVADEQACFGGVNPDFTATGTDINWYFDGELTNHLFIGNAFASDETDVGTYTYYVTNTENGCSSPTDTVNLNIYSIPNQLSIADGANCFGGNTANLTASGTNVNWYSDGELSNHLFSGTEYSSEETSAGSYTYYITQTINNCVSPNDTAILIIHPIPSVPNVADKSICFGESTPNFTFTGVNVNWYGDGELSNYLYNGNTFACGETEAGAHIYYVTLKENNCESLADPLTLTINAIPTEPISDDVTSWFGDAVTDLSATGTNIQWYSDSDLTNLLYSGEPFTTGETAIGNYTYYVTQSISNCESIADTVTLSIVAELPPPTVNDLVVCYGGVVQDLTADGINIKWYSDAELTNELHSGKTYSTEQTEIGNYTYYVTQNVNNFESLADTVILSILAKPSAPFVEDMSVCYGSVVSALTATGTSIKWYSDGELTSLLAENVSYTPLSSEVGTYYYYLTQEEGSCTSESATVIFTIFDLPNAEAGDDQEFCLGDSIEIGTSAIEGHSYIWTSAPAGENFSITNPTVSPKNITTYYLVETIDSTSCSGNDAVTISPNPLPEVQLNDTLFNIQEGEDTYITASGAIVYNWYTEEGDFISSNSNISVSPQAPQGYYVIGSNEFVCSDSAYAFVDVYCVPCSNETIYEKTGKIDHGCTGLKYNNNADCSWLITPPGVYNIYAKFSLTVFDVKEGDYVRIYDGETRGNTLIGSYNNVNLPPSEDLIVGSKMLIVFESDDSDSGLGFQLEYSDKAITSIFDVSFENSLNIYPNPNRGKFTIDYSGNKTEIQLIKIYSADGKIIELHKVNEATNHFSKTITLNDFTVGLYYVEVISDDYNWVRKVVVE